MDRLVLQSVRLLLMSSLCYMNESTLDAIWQSHCYLCIPSGESHGGKATGRVVSQPKPAQGGFQKHNRPVCRKKSPVSQRSSTCVHE